MVPDVCRDGEVCCRWFSLPSPPPSLWGRRAAPCHVWPWLPPVAVVAAVTGERGELQTPSIHWATALSLSSLSESSSSSSSLLLLPLLSLEEGVATAFPVAATGALAPLDVLERRERALPSRCSPGERGLRSLSIPSSFAVTVLGV